ncbi:MAG: hypothetical protein L0Y50_08030 [Beijerinckiaceae bacterium]|nr:hypothetical protein [Beijerinckiaceae bacterium]MCI0736205.1 hypothetical protein [Beijerinckiaceae bacterium]
MNEACLETRPAWRPDADEEGKPGPDKLTLTEGPRHVAVPIDQFGSWRTLSWSFALLVVLPILCAAAYYGLVAAGKYAVDFRFSVRSAAQLSAVEEDSALLSKLGKLGPHDTGHLPYMAAGYLRSRNIVRELDGDAWLRSIFSRHHADWLSRFDDTKSDDELWLFWQDMIRVNVDRVSGLVLVRVLAFTPEDALTLARATAVSAEKMIDGVAKRERRETLFLAERELERASLRYSAALSALRSTRDQEGAVDPQQAITSSIETLLGVMRQKLSLELDHDANLLVLTGDAPQQRVLSDQIRALDAQTASLAEALTSQQENAKTAARSIARFETQELEVRFSKRLLEIAQSAYERARQESERQHAYFALFVEPEKPDIAEYPRRARMVAFIGVCAFALWGIMMLAYGGIRDHKFER